MFGTGIHVSENPSQLTVFTPFNIFLILALSVFTVWPLVIFIFQNPVRPRRIAIFVVITLVVFGIFPSSSRLTLDRAAGTASLSRYFFYHWQTDTVPLDNLQGASVSTGSTTSKIILQYANGSVKSLSELNQVRSKYEAVNAINHFLVRQ